jgi:DNA-binding beta-propeller fold protein YncE
VRTNGIGQKPFCLFVVVTCLLASSIGVAGARAGAPRPSAYSPSTLYVVRNAGGPGFVRPVDLDTTTAGARIPMGESPRDVVITPDGHTAYVTNCDADRDVVTPIDLDTGVPGDPIEVGDCPMGVAITPNGRKVFVANSGAISGRSSVTPVRVATNTALPEIPIARWSRPEKIVVSPDGRMAYTADSQSNTVTPIDLRRRVALPAIRVGRDPTDLALSPDGRTAYVACLCNHMNTIDLATKTAHYGVTVGRWNQAIAVNRDGNMAYLGRDGEVLPVDLEAGTPGHPIAVSDFADVEDIVITPDGTTAWIAVDNGVRSIDLGARTLGPFVRTGYWALSIALAPPDPA